MADVQDEGKSAYPRITVVATCHNRERYVAETIESVLSQGYPNLEMIVIDDNSSDGSWEVIERYRPRLAQAERLSGDRPSPIHAINYALSKATGDVMTTLNDKNVLMPKSLFTIGAVFSRFPDIEWVSGIGLLINGDGMVTSVMPVRKDFFDHLVPTRWNIQHESTFWTRALWERAGGRLSDEYPWAFDAGLWSSFFAAGGKLWHLNTIVGAFRKIPGSHSLRNREEYYAYAAQARRALRSRQPFGTLAMAELYRGLRYLKPLLRNIPDAAYARIPLFNRFANDSIRFGNTGGSEYQLERYKRNPFRTIYPW